MALSFVDFIRNTQYADQIFDWINPETEEITVYAVSQLIRYLQKTDHPIDRLYIDRHFAQLCVRERGVDIEYAPEALKQRGHEPLVTLHLPNGNHHLIDGHHRYVGASMRGVHYLPAWEVPQSIWENFVLEDSEAAMQAALSPESIAERIAEAMTNA